MNALMQIIRSSGTANGSEILLTHMLVSTPVIGEKNRRLSAQSVRMAHKCISRMSELVDHLGPVPKSGEDELRRRLSQLSPTGSPIETGIPQEEELEVSDEGDNYVDQIVQPVPTKPVTLTMSTPQATEHRRVSNESPLKQVALTPGELAAFNLRKARKQFEKTQVQHLDPKRTEAILDDIIKRRQRNVTILSDLFQVVTGKVKDYQQASKERAEEDAWRIRLGKELASDEVYILDPIIGLLGTPGAPVAALTADFIRRQRDQISRSAIQQSIDEIHMFSYHLIDLLKHNHAELDLANHELHLKLTIQHYLFTTPLSVEYLMNLRNQNFDKDATFLKKCCELRWQDLLGKLGIKDRFKTLVTSRGEPILRDGDGFLADIVEEISRLNSKPTPYLKLACISEVCSNICLTISRLSQVPGSPPVEVNLGSEDLLLLLSFVLTRACPTDIHSQFMFMSELIPEEILRGESGYVLATLHTAIGHIENL